MKKNVKRVLIGSGIVVAGTAGIAAISHAITKFMMKVALDREAPKNIKHMDKAKEQLVGAPEVESFVNELLNAKNKLETSDCEVVEITSHDGEKLIGHWFACENAKRTIVAMHGWRSSWASDFGLIAEFWHENNCNVLYVEQRGQGESGGDYMGFGLLERYDCLGWINWVNECCGKEHPIYLGGVSMGATTVLMTAGLEIPKNVCGIVADCGFTSPDAIWRHVAENNLHLKYGIRSAAANDLCKKKINFTGKEYSTVEAMKHCSVPVLFIHGTDDAFVPVTMTYENYKACTAPKHLLVVPGADHGMSYYIDKNGYENAVKQFWNDYDCGKEEDNEQFV